MSDADEDAAALEFGRKLFAQECQFVKGVTHVRDVPPADLPEIAFAGRSNVGKSSLVNALTGRKTLARTSNTPGRTQELNFFVLGGAAYLVDLPGYGYARAQKTKVTAWTRLVRDYLRGRPNLRRVCVLIDARHGLKPSDAEVMQLLDSSAVPYQAILTKADKVNERMLAATLDRLREQLKANIALFPEIAVTSSVKGTGVAELRAQLAALAAN